MPVAHTSKYAFNRIKNKLSNKQELVYEAIEDLGKASNEAIADHLHWPINCVTGRVTELRKFGLIDVEGITKNKSGFTAKLWSVRDRNDTSLTAIKG